MSTVIKVDNLSKKYLINHEGKERYVALRDVLTDSAQKIGSRIFHPLQKSLNILPKKEEFWALKDVSFEVKQGERIGIIGRNGAGKSTLLKLLSRITEPTSGTIRLKGRVSSLLEVGTGFHPELTGRENIYLNGAVLGMSKIEIIRKFDEIVEFAEINKFLDTPVKRYSSGMQVRLAFAVAANLEPEILLVDEVLAVGDASFQTKCLGKMEEVSKGEGRTILFVSHNLNAVQQLCERGILIDKGEIVYEGSQTDTINKYFERIDVNSSKTSGTLEGHSKYLLDKDSNFISCKQFRISYFEMLDSNANPLPSLKCGARAVMRIGFESNIDYLTNLRFGIKFCDKQTGSFLTDFNSYYGDSAVYSCEKGTSSFAFEIDKVMLKPGQYILSIIVTSGLDVLDWKKDACIISVVEGDYYNTGRMPVAASSPLFYPDFMCKLDDEVELL